MADVVNGGLRYRVEPENPTAAFLKVSSLVDAAERISARTCEKCGAPGVMRVLTGDFTVTPQGYFTLGEDKIQVMLPNGWLKCLCSEHVDGAAVKWASHFVKDEGGGEEEE
jgi:hypothetical protein